MTNGQTMRAVSGLLLVGLVGCGAPEAGDDGAPQGQVYQSAIQVKDPAGRVRAGVALATRGFAGNAGSYLANTTLLLRDAGDRSARPPYQDRLERARSTLRETAAAEPERLAIAYVFEDDDVAGWTGPALSADAFRATGTSRPSADQTAIERGLVVGFAYEQDTFVRGYDGATTSYLCAYGGYALGNREPISTSNSVQAELQWSFPGQSTAIWPTTMIFNAANPSYNSGNWFMRGFGYYRVWFRHLAPVNYAGRLVVNAHMGCMF
jgi:hypothetical protein